MGATRNPARHIRWPIGQHLFRQQRWLPWEKDLASPATALRERLRAYVKVELFRPINHGHDDFDERQYSYNNLILVWQTPGDPKRPLATEIPHGLVIRAYDALHPDDQRVLRDMARCGEGIERRKRREIAAERGCTEQAVKKARARALDRLLIALYDVEK